MQAAVNDVNEQALCEMLCELRLNFPELRFGQLICTLAIAARDDEPESVRELEDAELLTAARRMLAERGATAAERSTSIIQNVLQ